MSPLPRSEFVVSPATLRTPDHCTRLSEPRPPTNLVYRYASAVVRLLDTKRGIHYNADVKSTTKEQVNG
jgi:hypothetical protein